MAASSEILKIASHFILSAPHGELKDVIADVKTIVGDNRILSDAVVDGLRMQYNVNHLNFARRLDESVILSSYSQVDANHYLDPKTNSVFQVNLETGDLVGQSVPSRVPLDNKLEEFRKAAESAVQNYADSYYSQDKFTYAVYGQRDNVVVVISARNMNLASMWSGGWTSTYVLPITKSGMTEMKGHIKLNVHYFEDGNVQLNTTFEKESNVRVESPESTGKALAAAIDKTESDFHKQLEEFYVNMNQSTFKAMRRILPPSRNTFQWNANAHKLASDLNK